MSVESFNNAIGRGSDAALFAARFDAAADRVSALLAEQGLNLDAESREQLKSIAEIKLAVFGDEPLDRSVLDGVKSLPGVRAQIQLCELNQQLAQPDSDFAKDLSRMSPSARMSLGRDLAAAQKSQESPTPRKAPDDLTLKWLMSLPPQARLSAARHAKII